ncbi:MAG: kelch repeat-containing protein [Anaerolineaceae bacterium]
MDNLPLSDREIEILQLVGQGKSNKEIAAELFISINTVKVHIGNIFQKINVTSRTEATLYAIEHGIIKSPAGPNSEVQVLVQAPLEALPPEPTRWQVFWKKYWWGVSLAGLAVLLGVSSLLASTPLFAAPTSTPNPYLSALNQERWQELAPMPQARAGMAVAAYDNAIYVIAGETESGPSTLVELYDPETDTWSQLHDKPTAVTNISAVLIGEKIYVPGGDQVDGTPTNKLEVYDPRKNVWESKADLPRAVSAYALAAYEGQMYLFGGWDGEKALDIVLRYDPLADAWHQASPLPTARAFAGAANANGKIYVMGGWDGEKALDVNESYAPARDLAGELAWNEESDLPTACAACRAESISEMLFVVGTNGIWQLNFPDNDWTEIPFNAIESGYKNFSSTITPSGYLYFIGGNDAVDLPIANAYRFRVIYTISIPNINK